MRRFSLYPRGKIFYVQFHNPTTRRYSGGRSTGQTNRDAAGAVVAEWLRNGIPETHATRRRGLGAFLEVDSIVTAVCAAEFTPDDAARIVEVLRSRGLVETAVVKAGPGADPLIGFLEAFWDFDKSAYVRERLAHGQRIGRRHCYDMMRLVRTVWKEHFAERHLCEVRRADLSSFALWLRNEKGWKAKTVNTAIAAGAVAFRWAHSNELIAANPAADFMHFSGKAEKRGVLTEAEVKKLFEVEWKHERARLGNATSMSTGLRAGEVLGLQVRDIGDDRLFIRHSWSDMDGLKSTKTGEERSVPLVANLRGALLDLARQNPNGAGPSTFIFWSTDRPDRPMDFHFLLDGLHDALLRLKLSGEDLEDADKVRAAREHWKGRRVVFHSWRHYFAARMADRLEKRKVMLATGHANGAVFDVYADHGTEETFQEVRRAGEEAFGKMLQFPEIKGT